MVLNFALAAALCGSVITARQPSSRVTNAGPSRSESVGIIGGGVSGIWSALELRELGYEDVTILEAGPEVGGKARSFELDGKSFPLGAVMTPFALRENSFSSSRIIDDPVGFVKNNLAHSLSRLQLLPANNLVVSPFNSQAIAPFLLNEDTFREVDSSWRSIFSARGAPERFYAHRVDFTSEEMSLMAQPAHEGLGSWGDKMRSWPLVFTSSHGYGLADAKITPPMYYWMRFAQKACNAAKIGVWWPHGARLPGGPTGPSLRGFDHNGHFDDMLHGSGIDVRTSCPALAVKRSANGPVRVETPGDEFEFDRLVVATDLHQALNFLDASEEETNLFQRVRHLDYYTVVTRAHVPALKAGHVYYVGPHQTVSETCAPTIIFRPYEDVDIVLSWAYGSGSVEGNVEEIAKRAKETLAALAEPTGWCGEVERVQRWGNYCPHVSAEDLSAGFYNRLDGLQGEQGTYYVGEVLNLSLVSECVDFSRYLMRRCFGDRENDAGRRHATAGRPNSWEVS